MKILDNYIPYKLNPSAWKSRFTEAPSEELSVIYVQRYSGPSTTCNPSTHNHWELGCLLDGKTELHMERKYPLKQGSVFLIAPHTVHFEYAPRHMEMVWIGLTGKLLKNLENIPLQLGVFPEMQKWFEELWHLGHHACGAVGPELEGLSKFLLAKFLRLVDQKNMLEMTNVINWINKNYQNQITVEMLAEQFGVSRSYFCRFFKKHTGKTPINMLIEIRLHHAIQMIQNTNLTIEQISRKVGYDDPFYFSRLFSNFFGHSPRTVRKAFRGKI